MDKATADSAGSYRKQKSSGLTIGHAADVLTEATIKRGNAIGALNRHDPDHTNRHVSHARPRLFSIAHDPLFLTSNIPVGLGWATGTGLPLLCSLAPNTRHGHRVGGRVCAVPYRSGYQGRCQSSSDQSDVFPSHPSFGHTRSPSAAS